MKKMPVLFIGHGSPMNAIENNQYSKQWSEFGKIIPKPKAILCISAHWTTRQTSITSNVKQRIIHDFQGFPERLNKMQYPANGNPELAKEISSIVKKTKVELDDSWGLDHGSWSVLVHMYPKAEIPVLQLSIDETLFNKDFYEIGKELSQLRTQGVLIIGLGNIVHNLGLMSHGSPHQFALDFENFVEEAVKKRDDDSLIHYEKIPSSKNACPTPEHYYPLLFVLGATQKEKPKVFLKKIELGSISMISFVFGDYNGK